MRFDNSFKIGCCQVVPMEFTIQIDQQEKQSLQPKFIEVLTYLAKHYPRIIPRDELIDNIWGSNSYVGEKSLTNAIWHLRKNLICDHDNQEVIETIRKVGYRLLVAPEWLEDNQEPIKQQSTKHSDNDHSTTITSDDNRSPINSYNHKYIQRFLPFAALFFIILLLVFNTQFNQEKTLTQVTITQITKQPGSELFPSPSPDGRYIVYKELTNGKASNLFMQDRLQPQLPPKQLTFDQAKEGHSVWSIDSKYLYFSRKKSSPKSCELIQLKVATNQEKVIATCPKNGGYYYLDVAPDGSLLAFHGYSEPADDSGIYFLDLTKENAKPYRFSCSNNCGYKDRDMAFSPDGKYIAVTRRVNRFNENIFLVDLKTKEATQLTTNEDDIVGLTWHPNGTKIIFATRNSDVRNGYILDVKSKESYPLNLPGFSYPSFAKHSGHLFYQQRDERYHIASLQLNDKLASSPFPVLQSDFNHHSADYSAVNDKITYVSNESGFYEIWQANPDGSQRQQLTYLKQTVRYPKWSHDGRKIAFLAPSSNKRSDLIYILALDSKKLTLLPSKFKEHHRPTWSFDDSKIISAIYGDEFTDLYEISLSNGSSKRLTFDGGRYGIMISKSTMLYTKRVKGLWKKDIDNDASALKVISDKVFNTLYSWNYQKDGIYFHKKSTHSYNLHFYSFANKKSNILIKLPLRSLSSSDSIIYIPKQDKLLFTGSSLPQANIKMLKHPLL